MRYELDWKRALRVTPLLLAAGLCASLLAQFASVPSALVRPLRFLDLIDHHRVTHTWGPNFIYAMIGEALGEMRVDERGDLTRTINVYRETWSPDMKGLRVGDSSLRVERGQSPWFDSIQGDEAVVVAASRMTGRSTLRVDAAATCTGSEAQSAGCHDGVKGAGEADVDCGGALCARCALGKTCAEDSDCASGRCGSGVCVASASDHGTTAEFLFTYLDSDWHRESFAHHMLNGEMGGASYLNPFLPWLTRPAAVGEPGWTE